MGRNIVTFAEGKPGDDAHFLLNQRITDLNARFAKLESLQALIYATVRQALDMSQNPRTIRSVAIVGGHLIVTYSDGTTQDAGPIGTALNTILNTLAGSILPSAQVDGEPAIYPPLYAEEAELRASIADSLGRLAALDQRLDALEA